MRTGIAPADSAAAKRRESERERERERHEARERERVPTTPTTGREGIKGATGGGGMHGVGVGKEEFAAECREGRGGEGGAVEVHGIVMCPATWGRGDDAAARREFGEGEVYPKEWVRVPNHFVES